MKRAIATGVVVLFAALAHSAEPVKVTGVTGHVRVINLARVGVIVAVDLDVDGTPGDGMIDEIIVGMTEERVDPFEAIAAIYSYPDPDMMIHVMRGDGGRGLTLWGGPSKMVETPTPMRAVQVRGIARYSGGAVKGRLDDIEALPMLRTLESLPGALRPQAQRRLEEAAAQMRLAARLPEYACRPCYPDPPPSDPDWPFGGGPRRTCHGPTCPNGGSCTVTCRSPEFPICGCLPDGAPGCTCG